MTAPPARTERPVLAGRRLLRATVGDWLEGALNLALMVAGIVFAAACWWLGVAYGLGGV